MMMSNSVKQSDLVDKVCDSICFDLTKAKTKAVVDAYLEAVDEAVRNMRPGDRVVTPLGIWSCKETKARKGRNPATGEVIEVPAGIKISFKPTKGLK